MSLLRGQHLVFGAMVVGNVLMFGAFVGRLGWVTGVLCFVGTWAVAFALFAVFGSLDGLKERWLAWRIRREMGQR